MGRFAISFRDTDDWPIDYGSAKIELQRHEFHLASTCVVDANLASPPATMSYLTQAARHFGRGRFANKCNGMSMSLCRVMSPLQSAVTELLT